MYNQLLSTANPGLILILIDQSGSMADIWEGSSRKCDAAAYAVNKVIGEIINLCQSGNNYKNRCAIGVITYGNNEVKPLFIHYVKDLAEDKTIKVSEIKKRIRNSQGQESIINERLRVFVEPKADGGTPMAEAVALATESTISFTLKYPQAFPPIVINITDGEPNDREITLKEAEKLREVKTQDGHLIFMNAHIPDQNSTHLGKIELPNTDFALSGNSFAKFLYDISSVIPNELLSKSARLNLNVLPNSRAFCFNADPEALIRLLNFGSIGLR